MSIIYNSNHKSQYYSQETTPRNSPTKHENNTIGIIFISTQKCLQTQIWASKKHSMKNPIYKANKRLRATDLTTHKNQKFWQASFDINDEFYTIYKEIEKEIQYYSYFLQDKIIYCNCDDYTKSNFVKYFLDNFNSLNIKRLIATSLGCDTVFIKNKKGIIYKKYEDYDGNFLSNLSIAILKKADVIITNPPFSKQRELLELCFANKKQFILITNCALLSTSYIIPYQKRKAIKAGYHRLNNFLDINGNIKTAPATWITNFDIQYTFQRLKQYTRLKFTELAHIPKIYIKQTKLGKWSNPTSQTVYLCFQNGYIPKNYNEPFFVTRDTIFNGILELGYEVCDNICHHDLHDIDAHQKNLFSRRLIKKVNN